MSEEERIAKELRAVYETGVTPDLIDDAADLIARLTRERDKAVSGGNELARQVVTLVDEVNALRSDLAALRARCERLEAFVGDCAEERCEYGDNCPTKAGTRNGQCSPCRARAALAFTERRTRGERRKENVGNGERLGLEWANFGDNRTTPDRRRANPQDRSER